MKRMKKIFAVLLSLAMVMGMSLTAFATGVDERNSSEAGVKEASDSGIIEVTGLEEGTKVNVYKIVSWNQAKGEWELAKAQGEENSWVANITDWGSITNSTSTNNTSGTVGTVTINWETIRSNLPESAPKADVEKTAASDGKVTFSNLEIGAYLVVADKEGTEYSAMGANLYYYSNGLMGAAKITINAKASDYTVTKSFNSGSTGGTEFIKRGEEIKYDISTIFPSFSYNSAREFTITDTPTGLTITGVSVSVSGGEVTQGTDYTLKNGDKSITDVSELKENDSVTVSFTNSYLDGEHGGKTVVVTVTAKATGDPTQGYSNKATTNKSEDEPTVDSTTGTITITKKSDKGEKLSGAKFQIKMNNEVLTFVPVAGEKGVYKLATSATETGHTQEVVVHDGENSEDKKGTLILRGLGAGTYSFTETVAPDGYSINNKIADVTLKKGEDTESATFDVVDTRMASLPSTGGIGTTIFTIGGCAIMIIAAALFFASRRKSAK